ncbi:DUF2272 domain-containing protein [Noviherbaspirillum sp. L7-7A]|uniref:DUF2272 domain-containing protein n=1 Tax=Noviherbaspirillum sp. L7-7A TaxID=2850560 RepID=UPI001C2CB91F|nr:DUF2272 domain-containing protein [Noviherbaspirillum sp. L7-7A]MBV0881976.1 DUF2272 domain-containing protein [Noviherbaspirillum sp. L7-7A]
MNAVRALVLGCAGLSLLFSSIEADANECAKTLPDNAVGSQIVRAAIKEYASFNGHRIDTAGRLWKFGSTETENESLLNAVTGEPDSSDARHLAWRRVWEYWLVLDRHVPSVALSRKVIAHPGALDGDAEDRTATEKTLRELFARLALEPSDVNESLRQAALRAALSDSPWSAAFISYVMHEAGLSDEQFRYAAAHWQYVKQAFGTDSRRIYRACDPRHTPPREGDLLCYSRGSRAPENFEEWLIAVTRPGFTAASHCEIVVLVDRTASKMETVGGNVLQSIAMRRLKLNGNGLLSASHYTGNTIRRMPSACAKDKSCREWDSNTQRWSVLLKLR